MSFGAIAEDYDRLRSGPSEEAVGWLLPQGAQVVVDLAAGTGLFTRALARKVGQVIAVEPDPRMRDVLRARSAGVQVMAGTGEAIPLPDASADGVFVSSAWHWMDAGRAVPEVGRVLRDGGRFGLIWSSRDRETGWLREVDRQLAAAPGQDPADRPDAQDPAAGPREAPRGDAARYRAVRPGQHRVIRLHPADDDQRHRRHAGHLQWPHHREPGRPGGGTRPRQDRARGAVPGY
jgi:SAM-dependent methyltransferase